MYRFPYRLALRFITCCLTWPIRVFGKAATIVPSQPVRMTVPVTNLRAAVNAVATVATKGEKNRKLSIHFDRSKNIEPNDSPETRSPVAKSC